MVFLKKEKSKEKIDTWYYPGYTANMKTAISIPDNLFRKADRYAKSRGYSRSELFAKAVEQYLEVHPFDHITKQLNEVYSSDQAALNEMLATIQFSSIEKEEW